MSSLALPYLLIVVDLVDDVVVHIQPPQSLDEAGELSLDVGLVHLPS